MGQSGLGPGMKVGILFQAPTPRGRDGEGAWNGGWFLLGQAKSKETLANGELRRR